MNELIKLTKDLKNASRTLSDGEARFLVDNYYTMQENRIRNDAQARSMAKDGEPCEVIQWLADQNRILEGEVKKALDAYSGAHPVGVWAKNQTGVGPVIAAGLLAHFDIHKAPTNGHFWSFAGLDPRQTWKKGQKRPWNAQVKTLCWKIGESFVKVVKKDSAVYGHLYAERKADEEARNERFEFADQAQRKLDTMNISKNTDAYAYYSIAKLPPAHIHERAKRYAVKRFISDLHYVWYMHEFGQEPPQPYPVAHLGHAHWQKPDVQSG
jgi:hypothetical protein